MGMFDFIKDAGKKLFGGEAEAAPAADEIKKEIESHGLSAEGLEVAVEGDTVKVKGKAKSQDIREKIILAAGNVLGIGKVEEAIETEAAEPESQFHTVEKGDSLWAIATKFYGNGSKYNAIFEANKPMLSDPDKIYPGQKLRIPPLD
ncbi:MAG: peptidoglycan-binding protein LysM [Pseudomonadota bacterium]